SQATIYFKDEIINENGNTLYDVSGRLLPVRIKRRISQNSFEIDISGLADGLYLLRVKVAGGYKTVRIIKGN
ncbi:MAG: T9SS type A sorting domain-containing protein, partial [Bacteroidetes bacterium]